MKVSVNWLRRYVDINVPLNELCDKMVMTGFEVDGIDDLSQTMNNVVVGRIVKLEKHPDADKLQICQLDVGKNEPVQIVTGADNVFEGALVPVSLHDSHLPNGVHIKKGKLRGVVSNGMLCSGEELCLKDCDYPGAEVHGIMILQEDYPAGTDMREVLGLNDVIIDFSVTANRPDCQCVLGIAREVAAALNTELKMPEPAYKTQGGNVHDYIKAEVQDKDLCPRYYGRVVKNVRIAPSPEWMKTCLKSAGMRSINNIVDITNFVMMETGQPMHAFDLRHVSKSQIIVRRAAEGETITTLDGKPHTLNSEMLVIADGEKPSCLAGIMGSEDSEVKPDTTDIFFECAKFRRENVRHTARTLGMRTESSSRFEKGIDIHNVQFAMERALQLIDELDAGDIVDGSIDCNDGLPEQRVITASADSINALLGLDIPAQDMAAILNKLFIKTTREGDTLHCSIPSFREDIDGRADLAEEVMRFYGYDHIVGTPMRGIVVRGNKLPERIHSDKLKKRLTAQGLQEITTYSFISSKMCDMLNLPADDNRRQQIALLNPLGEEYSVLRTQLTSSMLTVMSTNYNRKIPAVRFFELSKLFVPQSLPVKEQPEERPAMSIGMYGSEEDFFTLKGVIEDIFTGAGFTPEYVASSETYLHPGRQAYAMIDGKQAAVFGEVHPDTAGRFNIDTRVYIAEINLPLVFAAEDKLVIYKPLPRFPAVERDLAILCDEDLPAAEIEKTIRTSGGRHLENITLFDVYQGTQIAEGKKSIAYSLSFRSAQGTLTNSEIDPALEKIFKNLKEKGCILRS